MEKTKLKKILTIGAAVLLCGIALFALRNKNTSAVLSDVLTAVSQSTQEEESSYVAPEVSGSETELLVTEIAPVAEEKSSIRESGEYSDKNSVAEYIHTFGHLPSNFITKVKATELGWEGGSLEPYAPGKSIGGDRFGNREGLLPKKSGRTYTECDIDTRGKKSRGAKRIVFSNDGLVYYTGDHYETFELLYGEE